MRVDDPVGRVRGLAAEHQLTVRIEIELGARRLELAHARRPLFHQHLDGGRVAQRRSRGERVATMQRRRVTRAECGGDAALRIGGRAVEQRALGEEQHVAVLRRAPCGVQAGDPAADDEEAGDETLGHHCKLMSAEYRATAFNYHSQ